MAEWSLVVISFDSFCTTNSFNVPSCESFFLELHKASQMQSFTLMTPVQQWLHATAEAADKHKVSVGRVTASDLTSLSPPNCVSSYFHSSLFNMVIACIRQLERKLAQIMLEGLQPQSLTC